MDWGNEMIVIVSCFLGTTGILMLIKVGISDWYWKIKLSKMLKGYFSVYGEAIQEIQERQHKFTNQLNAIYSLCLLYDNYDDLVQKMQEELDNLKKYTMPAKLLILENPIIVSHVYQKMCEANKSNIELKMNFSCGLDTIDIPEIYMVEIIGNLLDNAMDEVKSRRLGEKVYFVVFQSEEGICIQVCNEHEKIPYSKYKEFFKRGYSSKGKGHGVGLAYVKKIVHKYRGDIEVGNIVMNNQNCFSVKIIFKERAIK